MQRISQCAVVKSPYVPARARETTMHYISAVQLQRDVRLIQFVHKLATNEIRPPVLAAVNYLSYWSGREDSNLRPLGPKPSALPGCATPRRLTRILRSDRRMVKLREKVTRAHQRAGTVADAVFDGVREFGEGLIVAVRNEERVVAEAAGATRRTG